MLEHKNYFIIGIKGAAMVHIAALLKSMGKYVTGADVEEVFPTDTVLLKNSIPWTSFEKAKLPAQTEVVIYAAAHGGKENPIAVEAEKKGIALVHQAEILGELLTQFPISLAVAGTHGKTTTSSMLAYALIQLEQKPSYMVGTPSFNEYEGSALGDSDYFVIEADEYAMNPPEDKTPKFHHLRPTNAIVTNIDFDHPDVYEDLQDTEKAFEAFMNQVASTNDAESLFLCADDENVMKLSKKLTGKSIATYGVSEEAEYRATNIRYYAEGTSFNVFFQDEKIGDFEIKLFGEKNVVNATGVITMLFQLGFIPSDIKTALSGFVGAKRRFEHIGTVNGVQVYDDYAHHPNELNAIIQAVKSRYPGYPVTILFQPHTYSRTEKLANEFIEALKGVNTAIVLPVFGSAREKVGKDSFTNKKLVEMTNQGDYQSIFAPETNEEAIELLKKRLKGNDIVLMAGAGDIYKLQPAILSMLETV